MLPDFATSLQLPANRKPFHFWQGGFPCGDPVNKRSTKPTQATKNWGAISGSPLSSEVQDLERHANCQLHVAAFTQRAKQVRVRIALLADQRIGHAGTRGIGELQ
jgi:hypothetical protein